MVRVRQPAQLALLSCLNQEALTWRGKWEVDVEPTESLRWNRQLPEPVPLCQG